MSQPLSERLSQFTPDGSGLDRDALLFAAGRASARPNRGWMVVAGALAACQLLTLTVVWPKNPAPIDMPRSLAMRHESAKGTPPSPADVSELSALSMQFFNSKDDDFPPAVPVANLIPSEPPLTSHSVSALDETN
jgi:hypothetical protein